MVTVNAASMLGLTDELGSLAPGRAADVSVLAIDEGDWTLQDSLGVRIKTDRRLRPVARAARRQGASLAVAAAGGAGPRGGVTAVPIQRVENTTTLQYTTPGVVYGRRPTIENHHGLPWRMRHMRPNCSSRARRSAVLVVATLALLQSSRVRR